MIDTEKDNRKLVERALLVGVQELGTSPEEIREHMLELRDLVTTMQVPIIGDITVNLRRPSPRYYLGSGKAKEITKLANEQEADCLIFDCDLTPSQQRNWEKLSKICVIDRQEVILDIFAARATTREAVIQVELARLQYSLPRLTRAWTHLSRQRGGAKGTRGEGEQQIEVDRRLVQRKISQLKKELSVVIKQRHTQRKKRERNAVPHAAIVGYTNAGKSSLLNILADSDVLVEDKLFATLDPTTRRINLPSGREMLLTDTVGFVRKLPHTLVEAFKSTLEEAVLADFIILVLDAANPYMEDHRTTTLEVLAELGAEDKEVIQLFNKMDIVDDPVLEARLKAGNPSSIFISAKSSRGIGELLKRLDEKISSSAEIYKLKIPPEKYELISRLHQRCKVLNLEYTDDGFAEIAATISAKEFPCFEKFCLK